MKRFFTIIFVVLLAFLPISCSDDDTTPGVICGTISNGGTQVPAAYYIILDDDTDESNGYIARQIINVSEETTSVPYSISTTNIAAGSYYLLAGFDFGTGNMDPTNSSKWESKAWYGGSTSYPVTPPDAPNITDLEAEYNISLISLP